MTSVTLLMDQSFLCHHTCQSSVPIMRVSSLCLEMVKTHLENNAGRLTKGIISFEKKHGGGGGVRLSVLMVQRDGSTGGKGRKPAEGQEVESWVGLSAVLC